MNRYCVNCKWFADGHFSKTYISPRCKQRGDDDCAYMRQVVCGIEGELYEPKEHEHCTGPESVKSL